MNYTPFIPVNPATGTMDVANTVKLPLALRNQLQIPTANQYVALFDSTRMLATMMGTLGAGASLPTPGPDRGFAAGKEFDFEAAADQNVALYCYGLDGAGAWQILRVVLGSDYVTIAAGSAPQRFVDIFPGVNDFLVLIKAGATPPTVLTTNGTVRYR